MKTAIVATLISILTSTLVLGETTIVQSRRFLAGGAHMARGAAIQRNQDHLMTWGYAERDELGLFGAPTIEAYAFWDADVLSAYVCIQEPGAYMLTVRTIWAAQERGKSRGIREVALFVDRDGSRFLLDMDRTKPVKGSQTYQEISTMDFLEAGDCLSVGVRYEVGNSAPKYTNVMIPRFLITKDD